MEKQKFKEFLKRRRKIIIVSLIVYATIFIIFIASLIDIDKKAKMTFLSKIYITLYILSSIALIIYILISGRKKLKLIMKVFGPVEKEEVKKAYDLLAKWNQERDTFEALGYQFRNNRKYEDYNTIITHNIHLITHKKRVSSHIVEFIEDLIKQTNIIRDETNEIQNSFYIILQEVNELFKSNSYEE